MDQPLPAAWQRALDDFQLFLKAERDLSPHTVLAYLTDMRSFALFQSQRGALCWRQVDREDFVAWLLFRQELGYSSSSRARAFIAVKVFFGFLKRERLCKWNITAGLSTPSVSSKLPAVLSKRELEALFSQPPPDNCLKGARDRALLLLLYSCGLRVSELLSLELDQVHDTFIRVYGKGGKERHLPIGRRALEAIDRYLHFRSEPIPSSLLFIDDRGKPFSRRQLWNLVKEYAKAASIDKNVSPHTLRHTFATHLLDEGTDIRIVQELLGHTKIDTTNRYMHLSRKRIQAAFNAFHPRPDG